VYSPLSWGWKQIQISKRCLLKFFRILDDGQKFKNLVIPSVIHHRQNPLESTIVVIWNNPEPAVEICTKLKILIQKEYKMWGLRGPYTINHVAQNCFAQHRFAHSRWSQSAPYTINHVAQHAMLRNMIDHVWATLGFSCRWVSRSRCSRIFYPENGGSSLFWIVCALLPNYKFYSRRP
jgi:hypothetical protein